MNTSIRAETILSIRKLNVNGLCTATETQLNVDNMFSSTFIRYIIFYIELKVQTLKLFDLNVF
jgi:hypothetical protein